MIAENIEAIRHRVEKACARAGRDPGSVRLIAVAKTFPPEAVRQAVAAGILDIGENYVQELLRKREEIADASIRWHFLGHLQSNKARAIVPWIDAIHAVDSESLGEEIARRASLAGSRVRVLVEVNTSGEASKFGVPPERAASLVRSLARMPHLEPTGLMTIGPFLPDPEQSRPAFRRLRELKGQIEHEGLPLAELSMGMTNDFEVAIEEGATMIRVGTAIFGRREKR
jgi:pyridoxal phosphate enzyme (YggS family)